MRSKLRPEPCRFPRAKDSPPGPAWPSPSFVRHCSHFRLISLLTQCITRHASSRVRAVGRRRVDSEGLPPLLSAQRIQELKGLLQEVKRLRKITDPSDWYSVRPPPCLVSSLRRFQFWI